HAVRTARSWRDIVDRKVAVKYRDRSGNTWAGRGAQPVWLREQLKAGAKLEDFAVTRSVASRKASASKKRRKAKRWIHSQSPQPGGGSACSHLPLALAFHFFSDLLAGDGILQSPRNLLGITAMVPGKTNQ